MRNRWRFSSLLLVMLMLSGCFGMHADSRKVERLLQEKYGMAFRITNYQSRGGTGTGDSVRVSATPVGYPNLEFSARLNNFGELEDNFLDYYGEYRVAQFFQQLANEVGFDALFQAVGTLSHKSTGDTVIARPLQSADPAQIITENTQMLYVNYVFVHATTDSERQEALANFYQFLERYQQQYPGLPMVIFRVAIGDAQQVAEATATSPRNQTPDDYQYIFRRKTLSILFEDGIQGLPTEEISEYFLADVPIALPPIERQSQESMSHN